MRGFVLRSTRAGAHSTQQWLSNVLHQLQVRVPLHSIEERDPVFESCDIGRNQFLTS